MIMSEDNNGNRNSIKPVRNNIALKNVKKQVTERERISTKIDTTVGYGQRGQPVPVVVPITVVASGYLPRWVLYLFTAYGTL